MESLTPLHLLFLLTYPAIIISTPTFSSRLQRPLRVNSEVWRHVRNGTLELTEDLVSLFDSADSDSDQIFLSFSPASKRQLGTSPAGKSVVLGKWALGSGKWPSASQGGELYVDDDDDWWDWYVFKFPAVELPYSVEAIYHPTFNASVCAEILIPSFSRESGVIEEETENNTGDVGGSEGHCQGTLLWLCKDQQLLMELGVGLKTERWILKDLIKPQTSIKLRAPSLGKFRT
ncbi:hypothetical protein FA15DRAFT_702450 [Coprinopsis marcescibilis]|uniref:Uncharacterized protein n=1 Tax=Coprinopsis marcescibilis TaxID=230819 RepID=A0A5C3L2B2_COPMA|nr:hypothetical protein FA15DRAFT_702450 [Coprinopsis marcescibilis]